MIMIIVSFDYSVYRVSGAILVSKGGDAMRLPDNDRKRKNDVRRWEIRTMKKPLLEECTKSCMSIVNNDN